MKVFLSFSGQRSRQLATVLSDWLQDVLQALEEPFLSSSIPKALGSSV